MKTSELTELIYPELVSDKKYSDLFNDRELVEKVLDGVSSCKNYTDYFPSDLGFIKVAKGLKHSLLLDEKDYNIVNFSIQLYERNNSFYYALFMNNTMLNKLVAITHNYKLTKAIASWNNVYVYSCINCGSKIEYTEDGRLVNSDNLIVPCDCLKIMNL